MSQHDYIIADAAGATFLADLNLALPALASLNSGATAPATMYAYMLWADTTSGWLKQRNAANSAWINVAPLGTRAWVDVASAATLNLDANAANSDKLRITGTTTTTAITLTEGQVRLLRAAAAWPITHGASLLCPGSASYTCAAGDLVMAIGEAAGVVRLMIWKADGTAVVGSTTQKLIQTIEATPITSVVTCSGTIPFDDTIPQNTEGTQVITVTITPTSATNRLRIEFDAGFATGSTTEYAVSALFQDSTASALAASVDGVTASVPSVALRLSYEMAAGTTSATTFKIRCGLGSGTLYINGDNAGARRFGGVAAARLRVIEYTP